MGNCFFVSLHPDTCIYIYKNSDTAIILTLHVDDDRSLGGNIPVLEAVKKKSMSRFRTTDMEISCVLGMRVTRDREKSTPTIGGHETCAGEVRIVDRQSPGYTRVRRGAITATTGK